MMQGRCLGDDNVTPGWRTDVAHRPELRRLEGRQHQPGVPVPVTQIAVSGGAPVRGLVSR